MALNRRALLQKTTGVALAGTVPSLTSASGTDVSDVYERSLHILETTGDVEKSRKFLRNQGWKMNIQEGIIPWQSTVDGPTKADIPRNLFKISLDMYQPLCDSERHIAQFSWQLTDAADPGNAGNCYSGTNGKDFAVLTWKEGSWYMEDGTDSAYMSDYVSIKTKDYGTNGVKFRFSDANAISNSCWDESQNEVWYGSAPVRPADGDFNPGSRQVWGVYTHKVYSGFGDWSLSFGGVSYSGRSNPVDWKAREDENGDNFIVSDIDDYC